MLGFVSLGLVPFAPLVATHVDRELSVCCFFFYFFFYAVDFGVIDLTSLLYDN